MTYWNNIVYNYINLQWKIVDANLKNVQRTKYVWAGTWLFKISLGAVPVNSVQPADAGQVSGWEGCRAWPQVASPDPIPQYAS